MTRRTAIKTTAGAWTALSWNRVMGANDRIRVGGIGTGGRCRYLLNLLKDLPGNELAAVCDVYAPRREEVQAKIAPAANIETDFRSVLDRKDIDAVVIGSPNHWHVPMALAAVAAGKDLYCEKPVIHTAEEAEPLIHAVENSSRIYQSGMQQRSWDHFQRAGELVTSGALGEIGLIQTYWYQNYGAFGKLPEMETERLDWKAWLGSAPVRDFDPIRYMRWRWFWDYGGGSLGDLYSHWVDVIHWFMNTSDIQTAQVIGHKSVHTEWECPDTLSAVYLYKRGFQTTFDGAMTGSLDGGGLVFRGTKGVLRLNRDGYGFYPEGAVPFESTHYPEPLEQRRTSGDGTRTHLQNWLDCIRSRAMPNAPVRTGVAAARAAQIGNNALQSMMKS